MSETLSLDWLRRSPDRFIALARANGDAFVYQRVDSITGTCRTVLVDGGYRTQDLLQELERAIGDSPIDILIVTHGDDDHTRGAQHLLKSSTTVREVWLPAVLAPVLKDLVASPSKASDSAFDAISGHPELVANILGGIRGLSKSTRQETGEAASSEQEDAAASEHEPRLILKPFPRQTNGVFGSAQLDEWAERQRASNNTRTEDDAVPAKIGADEVKRQVGLHSLRRRLMALPQKHLDELLARASLSRSEINQLVSGAKRIVDLAIAAASRGDQCRIRWFDVQRFLDGEQADGGYPGELVPLNAVEVHPDDTVLLPQASLLKSAPDSVVMFARFAYAFLSPSNSFGAVFEAPALGTHPGVIFSGDSDFSKTRRNATSAWWPAPLSSSANRTDVIFDVIQFLVRDGHYWPQWQHRMVITAPHHGSATNDRAYSAISAWFWPSSVFLVRGTSHRVGKVSSRFRGFPSASTCDGPWDPRKSRAVELVAEQLPWPSWVLQAQRSAET